MESDYLIYRRNLMLGKIERIKEKKIVELNNASKKRAKQNREYSKTRKQFLIEHPKCQVKGCRNVSTQIHHKKGRLGDLLTDTRYFLAVCQDHHTEIENHPEIAKEKGYSQSRLKIKS